MKIAILLVLAVAIAVGWRQFASAGETKVVLGKTVSAAKRVSMDRISHAAWDRLLKKHVAAQGGVDYQAWKADAGDIQDLDQYLNHLSTASPKIDATRNAKLAFWINAYNAVTIRGILREYPTTSIRNHTAKLVGYNIWDDLKLIVGDRQVSLNQMEHEILRKMQEPRIHFAINCASKSCPKLRNEAYMGEQLEQQLTDNALDFFANPENFQYDDSKQQFQLSSILKWFQEDFGQTKEQRLRTIAPWLPTPEAKAAANKGTGDIAYIEYDWSLNEQESK